MTEPEQTGGEEPVAEPDLKELILKGLIAAGGASYLQALAAADPKTFCALLAKILPLQVTGEGGGPVQVNFSTVYDPKPRRAD